jgi:hypothetical protein
MLWFAANRFTLSMLACGAAIVFGRTSKMSRELVCELVDGQMGPLRLGACGWGPGARAPAARGFLRRRAAR